MILPVVGIQCGVRELLKSFETMTDHAWAENGNEIILEHKNSLSIETEYICNQFSSRKSQAKINLLDTER